MTTASSEHERPSSPWRRRLAAAAVLLSACFPTVRLGSDRQESSTSSDPAATSTGAPSSKDPGTEVGSGGADGTTTAAMDGAASSSSSSGAPGDSPLGTTTDGACGVGSEPTPCLECAQRQCCDELMLCTIQQGCNCFLECLGTEQDPATCQRRCDPSSGIAAVTVCLAMNCPGLCD